MANVINVIFVILVIILIAFFLFSGGSLINQIGLQPPEARQNNPSDGNGASEPSSEKNAVKTVRIYTANYRAEKQDEEYIEISADYSNTEPVNISGWRLENRDKDYFIIPKGASLPYTAQVNIQGDIKLSPGEKAIIITGKSPFNTSFRPNICAGYFNRLYEFKPRLPEDCPDPDKEAGVSAQNNACFSYLKTLSKCQTPNLSSAPSDVNFACREFVEQRLNYAGCVEAHKNEAEFFSKEWRVYLEQNEEAWSNVRETIKLFDQNSNLIAETSI
ncbi:MAG: hypothetical protein A2931_04580 [Candidatus Niyogibacteria bacterium RIFCSPLOWO2_01_FULL_45_48]|uniref:LTD domain-containing protein n=2 Tax=Parcubacteria group TaxID=1794811 RepID=A0A1G2R6Z6_9BACT|nr:MAG: hypothetical protein A2931_04580 [Candidatus Niyogibacteria bacterium RIFCSPLOWO2_01_FULL_45_48]OHA68606.1 MAG: hypothetical protein A3D59_00575 [Candidatus Wildermuthbacteria bacterium RIFCSPHIGHO2_02_FULL_47_17]OHA75887.1 MAG: hypothetical protein A3I38_02875 [Candidatus Wildermuthbacteria bacterium RIFCSPLOWO2_02_FULL_47_10]